MLCCAVGRVLLASCVAQLGFAGGRHPDVGQRAPLSDTDAVVSWKRLLPAHVRQEVGLDYYLCQCPVVSREEGKPEVLSALAGEFRT